jgi:hypothetical protein
VPADIQTQDVSSYSFTLLNRLQDHSEDGKIRSVENFCDLIGNRTRDLPACSIGPRAFTQKRYPEFYKLLSCYTECSKSLESIT